MLKIPANQLECAASTNTQRPAGQMLDAQHAETSQSHKASRTSASVRSPTSPAGDHAPSTVITVSNDFPRGSVSTLTGSILLNLYINDLYQYELKGSV